MNAFTHQEIISSICSKVEAKGLQSVDLDPDLYITSFSDQDEQVRIDVAMVPSHQFEEFPAEHDAPSASSTEFEKHEARNKFK
jgi:hypothetical protein